MEIRFPICYKVIGGGVGKWGGTKKEKERKKVLLSCSQKSLQLKNFLSFKEIFMFGKLREFHDHCTLKRQNKKLRLSFFGADSQQKCGVGSLDHLGI